MRRRTSWCPARSGSVLPRMGVGTAVPSTLRGRSQGGRKHTEHLETALRTKRDIYRICPLALRFRIQTPSLVTEDYDRFFRDAGYAARRTLPHAIENLHAEHPRSTLDLIEAQTREGVASFILLEHEDGPELFVPAIVEQVAAYRPWIEAASAWVGLEVAKKLAGKSVDAALTGVVATLKEWFSSKPRYPLLHIDIRTEDKGVIRVPASEFDAAQIDCVRRNFESVADASGLLARCFEGTAARSFPSIRDASPSS